MIKAYILSILLLLSISACSQSGIGKMQSSELTEVTWFEENYQGYTPDPEAISTLKEQLSPYEFIVFGGTWCPDTRDLLPKFYKVTDQAEVPEDRTKLYFLNRKFKSPDGTEEQYEVTRVPTFILLKDGKEAGRIEESVEGSIEAKLLEMTK